MLVHPTELRGYVNDRLATLRSLRQQLELESSVSFRIPERSHDSQSRARPQAPMPRPCAELPSP